MKKFSFEQLIDKIEVVISKNRDLLSVKDVEDLEKCALDLKRMMNLDTNSNNSEYFKYAVEVILSFIKFFM